MRTVSSLWCRTRDARLSFEAGRVIVCQRKKKGGGCATFFSSIHLKSSEMLSEDKLKEKLLLPSYLKGFDA